MTGGTIITPEAVRSKIRLVAERALHDHPWRFKLWTPLIIIALRLELAPDGGGVDWLAKSLLPSINWSGQKPCEHQHHQHSPSGPAVCGALTASFHRTQFLLQFAKLLRTLHAIADHNYLLLPSAGAWTRFMTPDSTDKLLAVAGQCERWLETLYSIESLGIDGPALHPWEIQALNDFWMATSSASIAVLETLGNPQPGRLLSPIPSLADGARGDQLITFRQLLTALPPQVSGDTDLAILWYHKFGDTCHGRTLFSDRGLENIIPDGRSPSQWAAVSRGGPWTDWPALADLVTNTLRNYEPDLLSPADRAPRHEDRRLS